MNGDVSSPPVNQPEKKKKSWVWASCLKEPESFSVLAIIETVIAVGIYAYIAYRFGTLHLTIAACVAPFLLLRTDKSTRLGVRRAIPVASYLQEKLREPLDFLCDILEDRRDSPVYLMIYFLLGVLFIVMWACLTSIVFILIRISVGTYYFFKSPLECIREMPNNWFKFIFKIDISSDIEPLPGLEAHRKVVRRFLGGELTLSMLLNESIFGRDNQGIRDSFIDFIFLFSFSPLLIPVILYRWSIKGTSIIYLPLLYVVNSSFAGHIKERLILIKTLIINHMLRVYSAFVMAAFAFKVIYFNLLSTEIEILTENMQILFEAYVVPDFVPPWQWAAFINAILAWVLYLYADYVLKKSECSNTEIGVFADNTVKVASLLRGTLTIYTIACTLYISASLVPQIEIPPLGGKFFPWS